MVVVVAVAAAVVAVAAAGDYSCRSGGLQAQAQWGVASFERPLPCPAG